MSTHEQYAICLCLVKALSERGSWCGETHIQKSSYVMQTLRRRKPVWDFVLYKHGPYSFDLHSTVDELHQMDFLTFIVQPPYGPQIRLSENGKSLLEKLDTKASEYKEDVEKVARLLADKGVQQLEKIGTALLLSEEYGDDNDDLLARKLNEVKPHISLQDAVQAVRDYKQVANNFVSC